MAPKEILEAGFEVRGVGRRQFFKQIPEECGVRAALDEGWETSRAMEGDDQATGTTRVVEETPPSDRSKLLGSIDQDCMPRRHWSRQLGVHDAPWAGTAPGDPNHGARWTEVAGDLLEECGLAAALGADDCDPSSELLEPLPEILQGCAVMSIDKTLDAVAGKRIVGRPVNGGGNNIHVISTSTGVGPIRRSRRSV